MRSQTVKYMRLRLASQGTDTVHWYTSNPAGRLNVRAGISKVPATAKKWSL